MTDVPYINPILPESDYDGSEYDEKSGIALAHEVHDKEHLKDLDEHFSDELGAYYTKLYPLGEGLKEASGLSRKKKKIFSITNSKHE